MSLTLLMYTVLHAGHRGSHRQHVFARWPHDEEESRHESAATTGPRVHRLDILYMKQAGRKTTSLRVCVCACVFASVCVFVGGWVHVQKRQFCLVSRQINAGIAWFLMRNPLESKHKQGQLNTTWCERATEDLHLYRIQSAGWGNPLNETKPADMAHTYMIYFYFPSLREVDPSAAAKRIASKLCLRAETWLYGLTPQQRSHWLRDGKTAQSLSSGSGRCFLFFLKGGGEM